MARWKRPDWAKQGVSALIHLMKEVLDLDDDAVITVHDSFDRRRGYCISEIDVMTSDSSTRIGIVWMYSDWVSFTMLAAAEEFVSSDGEHEYEDGGVSIVPRDEAEQRLRFFLDKNVRLTLAHALLNNSLASSLGSPSPV